MLVLVREISCLGSQVNTKTQQRTLGQGDRCMLIVVGDPHVACALPGVQRILTLMLVREISCLGSQVNTKTQQ
jgi:hypothetical protein